MMKKSSRLSVFSDTLEDETKKLSFEAMGAYMRLLLLSHKEGGILQENIIASTILRTHTNRWMKFRAELLEKGFIVLIDGGRVAIKHFVNDGETRGVCPQLIDEQVVATKSTNTPPVTRGVFSNTPLVTPGVTPPVTPPVFSPKPAEILDPLFPTIPIPITILDNKQCSNTNSPREETTKSLGSEKAFEGHAKVFEAIVAAEPNLQIVSTALIYSWLANGCSPELDIIPTVQRMVKKAGPGAVKSLKYFDAAIQQSKVDRQSSPLQLTPSAKKNNVPSPYKIDQNIDYARGWTGDPSMVIGGLSDARN
jgi:hypothetical protein